MKSKFNRLLGSALVMAFSATAAHAAIWTGVTNGSWATAGNWTGTAPDNATAQAIVYNNTSAANLTQTLNSSYAITGITVVDPTAAVIVNNGSGTNTLTIGSDGIDLSSATQNLTLAGFNVAIGANQSWNVGTGRTLNVGSSGGTITLTNKLTKTGVGTFTLGGTAATTLTGAGVLEINGGTFTNNMQTGSSSAGRSGATTLTSGNLVISTSISMFGSGALNLNGGAIGSGTGTGRSIANAVNIGGDIAFGGTGFGTGLMTFSSTADLQNATRKFSSNLTSGLGTQFSNVISNGAIEVTGASAGILTLSGTNTYTGATTVTSGYLAIGNSAVSTSSSLSLAANTRLFVGVDGTTTVNNLSGVSSASIRTDFTISGASSARTLEVNQTTDGEFAGSFVQGGTRTISLIKKGAAVLTLSSTNGYTGTTKVSDGKLLINGSISTSTLTTIEAGGTLGGTGTTGALTNALGGTFAPGDGGIESLNISGNLTLAAGSFSNFEINTAGDAADLAIASALLAFGGTLNVNNIGGALVNGDVFNLFDWGTTSGAFSTINLPALTGGLTWDQSNLYTNGTIAVIPEPAATLLCGIGMLILLRRRRA